MCFIYFGIPLHTFTLSYWGYLITISENFSNYLLKPSYCSNGYFILIPSNENDKHNCLTLSRYWVFFWVMRFVETDFPVFSLWHMHVLILNAELFKRSPACHFWFAFWFTSQNVMYIWHNVITGYCFKLFVQINMSVSWILPSWHNMKIWIQKIFIPNVVSDM